MPSSSSSSSSSLPRCSSCRCCCYFRCLISFLLPLGFGAGRMGIDLNTVEEEEEEDDEEAAAPARSTGAGGSVCLQLWHACAGPRVWLPEKGSLVVYFPQGHLEQLGDLPPHVLCRVVDVKLRAEVDTDEVYAQLSLVAEVKELEQHLEDDQAGGNGQVEVSDSCWKSFATHMFRKTLTASDTSTHGGFSVPRRAAEDCFPPLDYRQQRPSQELVAKDLHGTKWKFRHIYRGQPRRHLLTTGWSAFINNKKLVSGDAVLFLRGNDGDLRLGIQRDEKNKRGIHSSGQKNLGTLTDFANAISARTAFCINYSPRTSQEFIIPYWKFTKSFCHSFAVGTRFKMQIDSEEAADRRYTGLITGVSELDPLRWPRSKWKCLLVRWDDEVAFVGVNRVSPWDIEPTGSVSLPNILPTAGPKRTKIYHPTSHLESPIRNGIGYSDLGESSRFLKVLQGQEIMCSRTPYGDLGLMKTKTGTRNCSRAPVDSSDLPYKGFGESIYLHKVFQGQEIDPLVHVPVFRGTPASTLPESGLRVFSHLLSTGNIWASSIQEFDGIGNSPAPSSQVSSPSSVLMFQQSSTLVPCPLTLLGIDKHERGNVVSSVRLPNTEKQMLSGSCNSMYNTSKEYTGSPESENNKNIHPGGRKNCMLFGFPLTGMIPVPSIADGSETVRPLETGMEHESASIMLFGSQMPKTSGRGIYDVKLGYEDEVILGLETVSST